MSTVRMAVLHETKVEVDRRTNRSCKNPETLRERIVITVLAA